MVYMLTKQNRPLQTLPPTSVSFFEAHDSFPTPKTHKRCTEQLRAHGLWLHTGMQSRWIPLDQPRTAHCCSKHDSGPTFLARKKNHKWSFHCNYKLNSSACKTQLLWTPQALLSSASSSLRIRCPVGIESECFCATLEPHGINQLRTRSCCQLKK